MNFRRAFLLPILYLALAGRAVATVERTVEKSFEMRAGARLTVDACEGPVRIEPSTDGKIHVRVLESMDLADEAAAEKRLQEVDLRMEQDDRGVTVKSRYRHALRWTWENWPPVSLSCVVKVPGGCTLDLLCRDGDLTVANFDGAANLRTENGAIFTGEIKGPLQIESQRGDVSVTACFDELLITAKSGNVTVGRAFGPVTIAATGGLVEVQKVQNKLRIDANGADIKVGFARPCRESAVLRASGGDIEAIFDLRDAFTLKASASRFGKVKVKNLTLVVAAGKADTSSLVGTLNGGGPVVQIDASGGNVRLVGREP